MPGAYRNRRGLGEVKAHFAECVRMAEQGEVIVLTRHGRPVARLVPFDSAEAVASGSRALGHGEPEEVRERPVDYEAQTQLERGATAARREAIERLMRDEIWPQIPEPLLGKGPTKTERERILGYEEEGV